MAIDNVIEYSIRGEDDKVEVEEKQLKSLINELYAKEIISLN